MSKAHVDAMAQSVSSPDSAPSSREVNSKPSRRKSVLPAETCETRADEADESSIEKKATPRKVASKKTNKSKSRSAVEQVEPVTDVADVPGEAFPINVDDAHNAEIQDVPTSIVYSFPNDSQFNVPEADSYCEESYDARSSSDRFFCSDEKLHDKFDEDFIDEFDDDFDEDFAQLDDMEFNEALDDAFDENDDTFDYSDDDIDSDLDTSDDDDFDKFNLDENFIEDSDDDFQTN